MAPASLVATEFDAGSKLITELVRSGFDVTAAAWIRASDSGRWHLYIASRDVDSRGLTDAYRFLQPIIRDTPNLWLDPFDVKLIGSASPIARDILEFQTYERKPVIARYKGYRLGDENVEEAFIYPPLAAKPPSQ